MSTCKCKAEEPRAEVEGMWTYMQGMGENGKDAHTILKLMRSACCILRGVL